LMYKNFEKVVATGGQNYDPSVNDPKENTFE